jgi:hypothetical protein
MAAFAARNFRAYTLVSFSLSFTTSVTISLNLGKSNVFICDTKSVMVVAVKLL